MNNTTKTTTDTNNKLPPPEQDIRSDLWPTMSLSQLHRQRDLIVDKITKLRSMMPFGAANPTVGALLSALQIALNDITALIDNKATQKLHLKKGP